MLVLSLSMRATVVKDSCLLLGYSIFVCYIAGEALACEV